MAIKKNEEYKKYVIIDPIEAIEDFINGEDVGDVTFVDIENGEMYTNMGDITLYDLQSGDFIAIKKNDC